MVKTIEKLAILTHDMEHNVITNASKNEISCKHH